MLNCRGPASRDDAARYTSEAPRGGAMGPTSTRRRRDVVADGGGGTENAHQHVGYPFRKRELATLNGRRQTDARAGRREAVSPLSTVVTRGFCISGSLSERKREIRVSRRASFLKIPPNSCLYDTGARPSATRKGSRSSLLVGDLSDVRVTGCFCNLVGLRGENTPRILLFTYSIIPAGIADLTLEIAVDGRLTSSTFLESRQIQISAIARWPPM